MSKAKQPDLKQMGERAYEDSTTTCSYRCGRGDRCMPGLTSGLPCCHEKDMTADESKCPKTGTTEHSDAEDLAEAQQRRERGAAANDAITDRAVNIAAIEKARKDRMSKAKQ